MSTTSRRALGRRLQGRRGRTPRVLNTGILKKSCTPMAGIPIHKAPSTTLTSPLLVRTLYTTHLPFPLTTGFDKFVNEPAAAHLSIRGVHHLLSFPQEGFSNSSRLSKAIVIKLLIACIRRVVGTPEDIEELQIASIEVNIHTPIGKLRV